MGTGANYQNRELDFRKYEDAENFLSSYGRLGRNRRIGSVERD